MRSLISFVAVAALAIPAFSLDEKPAEKIKEVPPPKRTRPEPVEPTLKVGDPAPPLAVTTWLTGSELAKFQAGKVYVVEFWATWCGPCIVMMPHLSDLQEQFRDRGLTIIGLTSEGPNNDRKKVEAFVKNRAAKLKYSMAFADNRDTYEAYMTASGQRGIPCTFVVDKAGKLAYIGHPMYLDLVLPKVIEGTWKEADREVIKEAEVAVQEMFKNLNAEDASEGLAKLKAFQTAYPQLKDIPYFQAPSLKLMIRAGKIADAKAAATQLLDKAVASGDASAANAIGGVLAGNKGDAADELNNLAMKAADKALALDSSDAVVLFLAARTYNTAGNAEKARELGAKAVEAAPNPQLKATLERMVKQFENKDEE